MSISTPEKSDKSLRWERGKKLSVSGVTNIAQLESNVKDLGYYFLCGDPESKVLAIREDYARVRAIYRVVYPAVQKAGMDTLKVQRMIEAKCFWRPGQKTKREKPAVAYTNQYESQQRVFVAIKRFIAQTNRMPRVNELVEAAKCHKQTASRLLKLYLTTGSGSSGRREKDYFPQALLLGGE